MEKNVKNKLTFKEYKNAVLENLSYSFKKYKDRPHFCILGCENLELDNVENLELIIQLTGKREIFRIPPKELYRDDNLINGFSKIEVRTITILGLIQEKKYSVSSVEFESIKFNMGKQIATFSHKITGEKIEKDVNEIPKCKKLINKLNPMDAFILGISYENQKNP